MDVVVVTTWERLSKKGKHTEVPKRSRHQNTNAASLHNLSYRDFFFLQPYLRRISMGFFNLKKYPSRLIQMNQNCPLTEKLDILKT